MKTRDTSVKRTPLQSARHHRSEHLPTQVGYDDELLSGRDPNEDNEHADEFI